ncbi:MAG TPA: ATP/GTP-binding protein [Chiayiivirga sp.]|nr:ATP/GTP-binding protein [Chiayiivirga sp.]
MKILFVGPPGAGKSTAIRAVSDYPPISTEVPSSDEKRMTTVAMDVGEIELGADEPVRLYGIPGQDRFDFLWPMVSEGAMGALFLIDASHPNQFDALNDYLDNFSSLVAAVPCLVVITRSDIAPTAPRAHAVVEHLASRGLNLAVIEADMRDKRDVLYLLGLLRTLIETTPESPKP